MIGIQHPKHVHLFRNTISHLLKEKHELRIVAKDKEVTCALLEHLQIPFTVLGRNQPSMGKKILSLAGQEYDTYKIMKEFKPDLVIGRAIPHLAHISYLLNIPFIIFEDTEAGAIHRITVPFASAVVTPSCFRGNFGKKQIRYNGFDELAYLHPDYFTPDPRTITQLGLSEGEPYIVLRFVSWNAHHDRGEHGIGDKLNLIKSLEKHGRVVISSEGNLPAEFRPYSVAISPEKIHDLLSFAALYMGEGGTMASEAAILGTPSIYISTLAGRLGNFISLEKKYGLLYSFTDDHAALEKAKEILMNKNSKKEWHLKRELLLKDSIDVTGFMIRFIENYLQKNEKICEE